MNETECALLMIGFIDDHTNATVVNENKNKNDQNLKNMNRNTNLIIRIE